MSRTLRARFLQDILLEGRDRHLNLYALAASAAGVSILALAQSAEASVIVTNTNIAINPGSSVTVDLNNDGAKDFAFAVAVGGYDHSFYATLAIKTLTGGKVVGGARG